MGFCTGQIATTSYRSPNELYQNSNPILGCSFSRTPQFFKQNPRFWSHLTQICSQNLYISLSTSKDNQNNNKHEIITPIFTKINIMFIFHQNPQFSQFSFKHHKQPHQFKTHQLTNMNKHSWSGFKHVSTTITRQFMIYTQISKNHQNQLWSLST